MIYRCKHFKIQELVSKEMYNRYKNNQWKLWLLFDKRILEQADLHRERYGRCYINNWVWGGTLQYCGFREPSCLEGSDISQHRYGRALDLHFTDWDLKDIRDTLIKDCIAGINKTITGIEKDVDWLHIDVRNSKELMLFGA